MNKTLRTTLGALVPATLLLLSASPAAFANDQPPARAALLNAGTAQTGIGPDGAVGGAISGAVPNAGSSSGQAEVAGVQTAPGDNEVGSQPVTEPTLGAPAWAASLNAGTAYTGIGPDGQIGGDISAAMPSSQSPADAGTPGMSTNPYAEIGGLSSAAMPPAVEANGGLRGLMAPGAYAAQLRLWTNAGYRVQPGHIWDFDLQRGNEPLPSTPNANVAVAGVQIGDGATGSYAEQLRLYTSQGYRIQPGYVDPAALINH